MVCYDMFGCPELGNWSSIWCVDVFDIGSNASTFRRRHLTDDPMTMTGALTGPAPAGFAALLVGGAADTSRGKVLPRDPRDLIAPERPDHRGRCAEPGSHHALVRALAAETGGV